MIAQEWQIILADILGKSREFIIAHPETELSPMQRRRFAAARQKLKQGVPLAYILGHRWFYGRKFKVSKDVLIPRPETELLVELAARTAKQFKPQIVADIGTGSGAIIISLRKELEKNKAKFLATDISSKSLSIAKQNAKNLKAKPIVFKKGNLAGHILKDLKGKKIIVAANLPYLSKKQLKEPSIKYEPKLALFGGIDAAKKIKGLLKQLSGADFISAEVFIEADPGQMREIKKAAQKYFHSPQIKIHRDLAGRSRIAQISILR